MRLWKGNFPGLWLTGYIIARAKTREEAIEMMKKELEDAGFDPDSLDLEEVEQIKDKAHIVYNGDY